MTAHPQFQIGALVEKIGGAYGGPGEICGAFEVAPGDWRYNVAHKIEGGFGKLIHIYNGRQLKRREAA